MIPNAATLTAISVLTSGAPNLDFTDAGNDTCAVSQSYTAGANCTVNVSFTPQFAGTRYGAVVLYDANGVAATAYIEGVGQGAQLSFLPPVQTAIGGGKPDGPIGVAVDGAGNVYFSNHTQILKETLSNGTYTQSVIPTTGLESAEQIAIDGAGNLYIADYGGQVLELTPSNGSYSQNTVASGLGHASGVAVDGAGNVYIDESFSGRLLKETLTASGYSQSVIGQFGGYGVPYATSKIAVDSSGNLYVTGDYLIYLETLTPGGYVQSTIEAKVLIPSGIALDGNGNIYVSEFDNNRVVKITFTGGSAGLDAVASVNEPEGLAFDGAGNLYVVTFSSASANAVVKLGLADAPPLNFGNVPYGASSSAGAQTLTLENTGNQPLQLPVLQSNDNPALSGDFVLANTAASTCPVVTSSSTGAGTLSGGASCTYQLSFEPTAIGPAAGSLVLTDNNLNAAGPQFASQTVQLTGTEVQAAQQITFGYIPPKGRYGRGPIAISATGGGSGNPVTFSVQGPGSLSGNQLKITGAGLVTVTANQTGNADYLAAAPVSATIDVEKAVLAVQAENAKREYGQPNPAFHCTINGYVDGDTAATAFTGAPALTTTATGTSDPGKYKITASAGTLRSKNYSFEFMDGTLKVIPIGIAAAPAFTPPAGSYKSTTSVTITDSTPDAVIHYTLNGSLPTESSQTYEKPIVVTKNETIKAIARAKGYTTSPVATAAYKIE
jgi:sugar lactone lactonase YvrE